MFQWPSSLDDRQALLHLAGSFWANTYQGNYLVESLLAARAQLDVQADNGIKDLLSSMSRQKVPVLITKNWFKLTVLASEVNQANYAHFDGIYAFDGTISYDVPVSGNVYAWLAPANLIEVKVILSAITNSAVNWVSGIDFNLRNGLLIFNQNPFVVPGFSPREIFAGGTVVDYELDLWLYRGQFDESTVYQQFGYVIDVMANSSTNYRNLINAVYDSLVQGTTELSVRQAISAGIDIPLALEEETVYCITEDMRNLWIITDKNAYAFVLGSTPVVEVEDTVIAGDTLTDAMEFFEFGSGQVPDDISTLAVTDGFLAQGYYQDLVFENKIVPLIVDTSGVYTRVSFEVGGIPGDVSKFWDDVHANGVAENRTLAMMMDQRPKSAQDTKPGPMALPAEINPLGFLLQNVFRDNVMVVKLRASQFGDNALGLRHLRVLRRMIPPHTALIVLLYQTFSDNIVMSGAGSSTGPGYKEKVGFFSAGKTGDSIDPGTMVRERVQLRQVGGFCR